MGHIDHGKTTLLDFIRKTKVVDQESGAITQHIGAYEVEVDFHKNLQKITFLDTPGHEAFKHMRSRGAKAADIAILVVAADEGVKPQTKEAIDHIQEAKIPFLVAINKVDKPEANAEKVKRELADNNVLVEGWGGNIPVAEISAKTGQGIDQLLDLIILLAEMEGLKGDRNKGAQGVVIESFLDSRRGYTVSLLITDGTLKRGDDLTIGNIKGKVKILENFKGKLIKEATFSSPVIVVGFDQLPKVGDPFVVGDNPALMVSDIEEKTCIHRDLSNVLVIGPDYNRYLNFILKADVLGSIEALVSSLEGLSQEKQWGFKVLKTEVGDISEVDVKLAEPINTIILAFRVKIRPELKNAISIASIDILSGDTIYELREALSKYLDDYEKSKTERRVFGKCKVLAMFNPVKGKPLLGGEVIEGQIDRRSLIEIYRQEEKIGEGTVLSLQQNRADIPVVDAPGQFGLNIDTNCDVQVGDTLVCYKR